jgi:hypothetical protein
LSQFQKRRANAQIGGLFGYDQALGGHAPSFTRPITQHDSTARSNHVTARASDRSTPL